MKCYIAKPRLSGMGGTIGYEKLFTGTLKQCLKKKPWGHFQIDCYGIGHRVRIFRENDDRKALYTFDEHEEGWLKNKV